MSTLLLAIDLLISHDEPCSYSSNSHANPCIPILFLTFVALYMKLIMLKIILSFLLKHNPCFAIFIVALKDRSLLLFKI